MCVCLHLCMYTSKEREFACALHVYTCACVYVVRMLCECVRVCMRVCVCVCVCVCVRGYDCVIKRAEGESQISCETPPTCICKCWDLKFLSKLMHDWSLLL